MSAWISKVSPTFTRSGMRSSRTATSGGAGRRKGTLKSFTPKSRARFDSASRSPSVCTPSVSTTARFE
jgi:hypothetical protein